MVSEKVARYYNLVQKRKACRICQRIGMKNPSTIFSGNRCLDCDEVDAWALWQNSLDADILLIGQEWGDVNGYIISFLSPNTVRSDTNLNLIKLFKSIGVDVDPPENNVKNNRLFFTNAALCLKENGGAQGPTDGVWYENCGNFIKELIDIIQPKIVITLGFRAYDAIVKTYHLNLPGYNKFADVIERTGNGIKITKDSTGRDILLFPVYHPAKRTINLGKKYNGKRYRSWEQMLGDWKRIEKYLPKIIEVKALT